MFRREQSHKKGVSSMAYHRAGLVMWRQRTLVTALAVAACVSSLSNRALAQAFEERWSVVPKAHADPAPPAAATPQTEIRPGPTPHIDTQAAPAPPAAAETAPPAQAGRETAPPAHAGTDTARP